MAYLCYGIWKGSMDAYFSVLKYSSPTVCFFFHPFIWTFTVDLCMYVFTYLSYTWSILLVLICLCLLELRWPWWFLNSIWNHLLLSWRTEHVQSQTALMVLISQIQEVWQPSFCLISAPLSSNWEGSYWGGWLGPQFTPALISSTCSAATPWICSSEHTSLLLLLL